MFLRKKYKSYYERMVNIMTYKQIEGAREVRLWIGQVIVPAVGVGIALMANPRTNNFIKEQINKVTKKNQNKN